MVMQLQNYEASIRACTTCPTLESNGGSRRPSVRMSLLAQSVAGLAQFCPQKLLQPTIFVHRNVPPAQVFAPAVQCCTQKLRGSEIFPHSTALQGQIVHAWCTVRAKQVSQ